MPAEQRGYVYSTKRGYGIRSPFATKSEARRWLRGHLDSGLRLDGSSTTFDALCEDYLASHTAEASTLRTLRLRLVRPRAEFGPLLLPALETRVREIAAWRRTLPAGSAYGIVSAFRQVCEAGVRWRLMASNPVRASGPNKQRRRGELEPFTLAEIDALAAELGSVFGGLVVFAAETALRPAEMLALEWRDVHRAGGVVLVERALGAAGVKPHPKTDLSRRQVPLSRRALVALDGVPRRLDSRLVWTDTRGGHLDLDNWRREEWAPALEAAGVPRRRIYDLRHTAISNWLAAGIGVFEVSRYAGTSLAMISSVYGHLTVGATAAAASRMDALAAECAEIVPKVADGAGPANPANPGG